MRFGEELREERERRGLSLEDVAVSTRVSLRHLSALEENRFAELPGGVFSRGIVRSYAQCCGLDTDGTVQEFLAAMRASGIVAEQKDDDWIEFAEAVRRNRTVTKTPRRLRWFGVLLMLTALVVAASSILWLLIARHVVQVPSKLEERIQHLRRS